MTRRAAAVFLALLVTPLAAQDAGVPKDSLLVTLNGCAKNGNFVVGERREDQPGTLDIEPGRRFRLNGDKKLLNDIKAHQRSAVQVTGVIRKADFNPQGISVLGGQVRIGGAPLPRDPIANPTRDPITNRPATLDLRSWQPLTGDCR